MVILSTAMIMSGPLMPAMMAEDAGAERPLGNLPHNSGYKQEGIS